MSWAVWRELIVHLVHTTQKLEARVSPFAWIVPKEPFAPITGGPLTEFHVTPVNMLVLCTLSCHASTTLLTSFFIFYLKFK